MTITLARPDEIDSAWPVVAPMFQTCVDRCGDDYTTGELWQMLRSGNAFLVIDANDGAVRMVSAWQFQRWDGEPVFRCLSLAAETGSIDHWGSDLTAFIKRMMKDGEASRLVFEGREWAAFFRKQGLHAEKLRSTFEVRL